MFFWVSRASQKDSTFYQKYYNKLMTLDPIPTDTSTQPKDETPAEGTNISPPPLHISNRVSHPHETPGLKTVGCKWIFKKKTDMDGKVHTFNARLVAKGFSQTQGIDYDETFYPVAKIKSIRVLLAIAAYYDYEIW